MRWLFLRGLGLVYLSAFTSLGRQVLGLYGARGIAPLRERLALPPGTPALTRLRRAPTLLWSDSSDRTLVAACRAGQLLSLALVFNVAPRAALAGLWTLYVSFTSIGRPFLSYQWDALLLETSWHGLLVAPGGLRPGAGRRAPHAAAILLLRWLCFRLHFQSGVAKLASADQTWRNLTACHFHLTTQPLPTPLGWEARQLPLRVHQAATAAVLALEVVAPWLAFGPRRARQVGCFALAGLQLAIIATGNYAFFNLLSLLLALWLLDDEALLAALPARWRGRALSAEDARDAGHAHASSLLASGGAVLIFSLTLIEQAVTRLEKPPRALVNLLVSLAPLRSINRYGLFSVMTTRRPEIEIEASRDGVSWRPYEFRYKPSSPRSRPRWIAPHQPRLDWQLWFAALAYPPRWFVSFLARLLEGSPEVLALLERAPFDGEPPRLVRATLYEYRMTDRETRERTGAYWTREELGVYFPPTRLDRELAADAGLTPAADAEARRRPAPRAR